MRWFLPFSAWYVMVLALTANSAWELAHGDLAFGVPSMCVIFLLLDWVLWRNMLWARSAEAAARASVEQVLRERTRAGEHTWRDERARLTAVHLGHLFWAGWAVCRADEDQFSDVTALGRAPVTVERYMLARVFPRVPRVIAGAMVTAGGDIDYAPEPEQGLMWAVQLTGLAGARKGAHAFADTADLAGLAAQLRTAEAVTSSLLWVGQSRPPHARVAIHNTHDARRSNVRWRDEAWFQRSGRSVESCQHRGHANKHANYPQLACCPWPTRSSTAPTSASRCSPTPPGAP